MQCTLQYWYTRLTTLCPELPRWAGTRKVKPIWILLKQETVSGSDMSCTICKSAHHSRQITAPHHTFFTGQMPFLPPNQQCQHWRNYTIDTLSQKTFTFCYLKCKTEKVKKTDMLRSDSKSLANPCIQSWRRKGKAAVGIGLQPFYCRNPGRGVWRQSAPQPTGVQEYHPEKTFGIVYVIWYISMHSGGSYL